MDLDRTNRVNPNDLSNGSNRGDHSTGVAHRDRDTAESREGGGTSGEYVPTVVIGAGQAGLATGYHLQRHDQPFVILDSAARIGDQWRRVWDSLRLYSPAGHDGLPGLPFPGPAWSFPSKDEVADYLERYAAHHRLPVRLGTRVLAVTASGGGYRVRTGTGEIRCDNVVVATGTFGHTPRVPDGDAGLDPGIVQLHSSEYRRPGQLRPGRVLVVGASHSGCDIAYEVAETHPTTLAGRDCGQIPFRFDSAAGRMLFGPMVFAWKHVLTRGTPAGRAIMPKIRQHGHPMIRVRRGDLAARGVERLTERFAGVRDGRPVVGDRALDVATVVWATGFRQSFDWVELPVFDEAGWPREYRGVVDDAPGLFFCGLAFQYAFSSMVLPGVGRDARYVADRIRARARRPQAVSA